MTGFAELPSNLDTLAYYKLLSYNFDRPLGYMVECLNCSDEMENCLDPGLSIPSGSTLFAHLSKVKMVKQTVMYIWDNQCAGASLGLAD